METKPLNSISMLENVYSVTHYTKIYDDKPTDVEDRFFERIKYEISVTKISDIAIVVKDFDIPQGFWSGAKKVKLCEVSFKDTNLQKFRTYFNASIDGNVVLFSRYDHIAKGFFDPTTASAHDIYRNSRAKFGFFAYEKFVLFDMTMGLVFDNTVGHFVPEKSIDLSKKG